jgi:alpha-D-ribose 1-methylphosphonate 5-triphosphate synthase subunit PhnG
MQSQAAPQVATQAAAQPDIGNSPEIAARRRWMAVLARASAEAMQACLAGAPALPRHVTLRGPESGLVMLRGRAGGAGAAFNLGEMTVTRCTVRAGNHVGHATVTGRDAARAELAARLDAALQDPALHDPLHAHVIEVLARRQHDARQETARKAAATQVKFFTMATMRS